MSNKRKRNIQYIGVLVSCVKPLIPQHINRTRNFLKSCDTIYGGSCSQDKLKINGISLNLAQDDICTLAKV